MRRLAVITAVVLVLGCKPTSNVPDGLWVSHGQWHTMVRENKPPLEVAAAVVVRVCGDGSLVIADTNLLRFEQNIWVSTGRNYRGTWRNLSSRELGFEYAYEGLVNGKTQYPTIVSSAFIRNDQLRFDLLRQVPRPGSARGEIQPDAAPAGRVVPLTLLPADTLPARLDTFQMPCGDTRYRVTTVNTLY